MVCSRIFPRRFIQSHHPSNGQTPGFGDVAACRRPTLYLILTYSFSAAPKDLIASRRGGGAPAFLSRRRSAFRLDERLFAVDAEKARPVNTPDLSAPFSKISIGPLSIRRSSAPGPPGFFLPNDSASAITRIERCHLSAKYVVHWTISHLPSRYASRDLALLTTSIPCTHRLDNDPRGPRGNGVPR